MQHFQAVSAESRNLSTLWGEDAPAFGKGLRGRWGLFNEWQITNSYLVFNDGARSRARTLSTLLPSMSDMLIVILMIPKMRRMTPTKLKKMARLL
jgi:hypothetical protein